jgi:AcrR family transcriptional regulator
MTGVGKAEPPERRRDAERTRAEILDVATEEFADRGYSGARVDEIAARTRTTKRMIYYYFSSKQGLYMAVLERAYSEIRLLEQQLDVDHLDPAAAVRALAELTFDHHQSHPLFYRLVSIENTHRAEHLRRSPALPGLAGSVVEVLDGILDRGRAAGMFRTDVDALDVHMMIHAFCSFRFTFRYTFDALFHRDMLDPAWGAHHRRMLGDLLLAYLVAPSATSRD